jgi:uncharacterized membrane protein SpoIIM required for sporulation
VQASEVPAELPGHFLLSAVSLWRFAGAFVAKRLTRRSSSRMIAARVAVQHRNAFASDALSPISAVLGAYIQGTRATDRGESS